MTLTSTSAGVRPRLHGWALRAAGALLSPLGGRGMRTVVRHSARVLGHGHEGVVTRSGGGRFRIALDDPYWAPLVSAGFHYEPEVEAALARLLGPHTAFVDCGANIGYWSVTVAPRVCRVVAVEASPTLAARIEDNARLSGRDVTVVQAAVWRHDGEVLDFTEYPDQPQASGVSSAVLSGHPEQAAHYSVSTRSLDSLVAEHCGPEEPVLVKIDVEGAESEALAGARELLSTRRCALVYEEHGTDPSCRLTLELVALGLRVEDPVTGAELRVDEIRARKTDRARAYNYAATTRSWREAAPRGG